MGASYVKSTSTQSSERQTSWHWWTLSRRSQERRHTFQGALLILTKKPPPTPRTSRSRKRGSGSLAFKTFFNCDSSSNLITSRSTVKMKLTACNTGPWGLFEFAGTEVCHSESACRSHRDLVGRHRRAMTGLPVIRKHSACC